MVSGNVSSYSRLLNGDKRLKQLQDYNELAAAVALVSADVESDKAKKAAMAKKTKSDKEQKKQQAKAKEAAKHEELYPQLEEVVHTFVHSCDIDDLQRLYCAMSFDTTLKRLLQVLCT